MIWKGLCAAFGELVVHYYPQTDRGKVAFDRVGSLLLVICLHLAVVNCNDHVSIHGRNGEPKEVRILKIVMFSSFS